jgi:hypothetical protein
MKILLSLIAGVMESLFVGGDITSVFRTDGRLDDKKVAKWLHG